MDKQSADKIAALSTKVAAMSDEQREVRAMELARIENMTPEESLEFAEITLGSGFSFAEE